MALRSISKKMKVTAAQRVVMTLAGVEREVAYTNVDTARRMRGCFSASDERCGSCGRVWTFLFLPAAIFSLEEPASDLPGALGRPPHRSGAHQRTSIREQSVDKARRLMGETAGTLDVRGYCSRRFHVQSFGHVFQGQ